jgi:hypothetical protein
LARGRDRRTLDRVRRLRAQVRSRSLKARSILRRGELGQLVGKRGQGVGDGWIQATPSAVTWFRSLD